MTESKRKKQVRRWKHLKERYNKLRRSLKEDEDLDTKRKHLPSAGEIIDLEADGSIDREHAIGKLTGRGYDDDAAADMVDNYNSAEELEEEVRSPSATPAETKVNEMVSRDSQAYYRDAVYTGEMTPLEVITDLEIDYGVPGWAAEEWITAVTGDS